MLRSLVEDAAEITAIGVFLFTVMLWSQAFAGV